MFKNHGLHQVPDSSILISISSSNPSPCHSQFVPQTRGIVVFVILNTMNYLLEYMKERKFYIYMQLYHSINSDIKYFIWDDVLNVVSQIEIFPFYYAHISWYT